MRWEILPTKIRKIDGDHAYDPIVEKLLTQRGIFTCEEADRFLHPQYERDMHDPFLFVQMKSVVERIRKARDANEIVGIFGDHDVDGISGATVLADGLEALGIETHVYIPDKHTEGHGINIKAIDEFHQADVTLMISVDCGMTNIDEVRYAKEKGIATIIIDHHHVPAVTPDAYAIINPQMKESGYPFKSLCGTGCAFKVVQALYSDMLPEEEDQLKWMLDIVCIGTVADCMDLVGENRVIVQYGLIVLQKTRRLGYQEMIQVGRILIDETHPATAETIAFQIAPRINAAGRMAHARDAYNLLHTTDYDEARAGAEDLEQKNLARRKITEKLTKEVEKIVTKEFQDKPFIFVAAEHYPIGIVGIVAGRIAEKHGKPTGVFVIEGGEARGSFRSPKHISIIDVLEKSSEHLMKFGGHAAAAGATLKTTNIKKFVNSAAKHVSAAKGKDVVEKTHNADMKLDAAEIDVHLVNDLMKFAPFGHGNREPLFWITGIHFRDAKCVGKTKKHLKASVASLTHPKSFDAIGFSMCDEDNLPPLGEEIEILAYIRENEWNGNISIQFNLVEWRFAVKN